MFVVSKKGFVKQLSFQESCLITLRKQAALHWASLVFLLFAVGSTNALAAGPISKSFDVGVKYYANGDYTRALNPLKEAVAAEENNVNARYYLADTLTRLNKRLEAQEQYQRILQVAPNSQAARMAIQGLIWLKNSETSAGGRWQLAGDTRQHREDRYTGPIGDGKQFLDKISTVNGLVRWSLLEPIKVYIEESPAGIRNFQPGFTSQVRLALDQWMLGLGNQMSYQLQTIPDGANIKVNWTNTLDTRGHDNGDGGTAYTAGLTVPRIQNGSLATMLVTLSTFDIRGRAQQEDIIYAVALHELGHALGLLGHSENPADVMNARNNRIRQLSPGDLSTVRALYAVAADLDNRQPEDRKQSPEQQAKQADRIDAMIVSQEALVKKDPSALNELNLGITYFQKGRVIEGYGAAAKGAETLWYKKSLSAFDAAISMEPDDASAYHRRSLVYQAMNDIPKALENIRQAITLEKREPDYYMLQAWYLARLGQRAEAQDSLNTYLISKPSAAGSSEVQQIRQAIQKKPE